MLFVRCPKLNYDLKHVAQVVVYKGKRTTETATLTTTAGPAHTCRPTPSERSPGPMQKCLDDFPKLVAKARLESAPPNYKKEAVQQSRYRRRQHRSIEHATERLRIMALGSPHRTYSTRRRARTCPGHPVKSNRLFSIVALRTLRLRNLFQLNNVI
ncbi:hypothetical protein EVAR_97999_1 [Eumeta japonica]|uniref:Uncharacterized protein n=1 Tax=Eumeta variegata TaxID=151549 RepID=A0A4C1WM26_EUMVA|nr:hypothetical protein EVAR_97999_1 [Eumeta japonica]